MGEPAFEKERGTNNSTLAVKTAASYNYHV